MATRGTLVLRPNAHVAVDRSDAERVTIDEPPSGVLKLLRKPPWVTALVVGLALLDLGVFVTYQGPKIGGLVLVCLGVSGALVGVGGLLLVRNVGHLRDRLAVKFSDQLENWLPPKT